MRNDVIDKQKIKEALSILKLDGQLFEIRILKGKKIISGYFKSIDVMLKQLDTVDLNGTNIFYSLNYINEDCYCREQKDCFRLNVTTTSDTDIDSFQWLLIDLDPVRKRGISSTKEELVKAYDLARRIIEYLRDRQWPAPVMALSGNGIHLLYGIGLKNTEDNASILERCLKALNLIFSDQYVEIDTSVFNPSRVSKLYGSTAQKGSDTKERPHRMARIITKPDKVEQVKKEQLEKLASEYEDSQPVQKSSKSSSFDIEGWIEEHGIRVARVDTWKDTTKYVLEECPFDSNHKAPDSTIIKQPSGAIAFKCFHNSCSGHDWHELRLMYEPDAYDDKTFEQDQRIEDGWKAYKAFNRQRTDIEYKEAETPENPSDMFLSAKQILAMPKEERICIPTGLKEFDKRVGGLAKGEITLVSGMRGAAKSTWLNQVALGAINHGFSTLVYSGELKNERFMNWLFQQAAGKDHVERSKKYNDFWYCKNEVKPKIAEWLDGKFFLYNNNYGSNFRQIAEVLQKVIKNYRSDLVIIDNMSILDLSDITSDRKADKWDHQKLFVETLKNISMICNCHIIFVAHPRKAMGFLRLDDVGGSGSLGNFVDNAFIVHRKNSDFQKGYDNNFGKGKCDRKFNSLVDNVIEVVKERETGMQDVFIPLYYEQSTRRLKNDMDERIVYGWDSDGFIGEWLEPDQDLPFH